MVSHALKLKNVRVILVDNVGPWSTNGVLNLPETIVRPKDQAVGIAWSESSIEAFKEGTFVRNYRQGTIDVIKPNHPVFDAVILEP
jgi:hypothetical protein